VNNFVQCTKEKHSYIGTQQKGRFNQRLQLSIEFLVYQVWMKMNLPMVKYLHIDNDLVLFNAMLVSFDFLAEASLHDIIAEYQQISNYDLDDQIIDSSSKTLLPN
jgi:hypothetical protein